MKKVWKEYRMAIAFIAIEGFFYYRGMSHSAFSQDTFFFFWGALWLTILFFSVSGGSKLGPLRGLGTVTNNSALNSSMLAGEAAERHFNREVKHHNTLIRVPINYVYLALFSLNVVAYLIVM